MDTRQLDAILRRNEETAETFVGVYALDELASVASEATRWRDRWFLVCNCCPSSQRGQHWVGIFYECGEVEFFDSFGLSPVAYDEALLTFIQSLTTHRLDVTYNNVPSQAFDSDACGHYTTWPFVLTCRRRHVRTDSGHGYKDFCKHIIIVNELYCKK